jgi:hypothetical protein
MRNSLAFEMHPWGAWCLTYGSYMLYVRSGGDKPLYNFVVGQSATNQINNTKSFVANGKVAGEDSTN